MSHSAHPFSLRLGIIRDWRSRWFDRRNYRRLLKGDILIREWLIKRLRGSYIGEITMERSPALFHVIIKTARPGLVIGRGGEGIEKLRKAILRHIAKIGIGGAAPGQLKISVEEIQAPDTHAAIVAYMIAEELEKRMHFRRVIKKSIDKVIAAKGVRGVRVTLSGRLGGAEMSRHESLMKGQIPLQTLRADVDFARERAHLPYGDIGIKVWVYRGEIFPENQGAKRP